MKYIVANWKMNKDENQAINFLKELNVNIKNNDTNLCRVLVAPPVIYISRLSDYFYALTAQNVSSEENGAYTGEVSASMLSKYVKYAIVGHSERRVFFNEHNDILLKKIQKCFKYNIVPIFCFGENSEHRKSGNYLSIIESQLRSVIASLSPDNTDIILAYEPIWAIGTGKHANVSQINEVHNYVRSLISKTIVSNSVNRIPILYGGSCNSDNAKMILKQENVDGLLIGGASLDIYHFLKIIKIANEVS